MMADGKNNDVIDITKLIMAVMVVSIHVNPGGGPEHWCWQELQFPCFLLLGHIFSFKKYRKVITEQKL